MLKSSAPQALITILTPILEKAGFWRFPHMDYFVRVRGDIRDIVGWHKGLASERYTVYFGVWVPELEPDLQGVRVDESEHIRNTSLAHDLSLADTRQLTEWWDENQGIHAASQAYLTRQILHIAFPYFDTFASIGDVAEMVFYDERFHNTEIEGRLLENAFSSLFNYDLDHVTDQVALALKPLQKLTPAFNYSGGYYWRYFGDDVFHIIFPRFFAAWRFVEIQLVVWHPSLDALEQAPQILPAGFSQVAWRSFSADGQNSSSMLPAFLGESTEQATTLDDLLEGIRSHGLIWLEKINSKKQVYDSIRPEFKKFFPEN